MAAVLTLLFIGYLLQSALCQEFKVIMPQAIEVLRGSCVTIPCSFDVVKQYERYLEGTCKALWRQWNQLTVVFDSGNPRTATINGSLTGDLTKKDCTTTLNNMTPEHSNRYALRLDCPSGLKYNFDQSVAISVTDDPPRPTVTPSTLKVKEGTPVTMKCSAPAPCLSHPPTLTWTPSLGEILESLQENEDKTKVKTSVLSFTASHIHHKQEISCTAVYSKQDGSTESSVSTSLTADISFAPLILPSSDCTKTVDHLSCSCYTVGNPSPILQWYLDGSPVNHSDKFAISKESLNDTGLRSFITVKPQERDLSTLLCHSSNSLGSASQRFYIYSFSLDQLLGPYSGALLLSVVAVSLSVNVLGAIYMVFLWKSRKSVKPTEEDRTYMTLDRRDRSPEYDVIGQTPK